MNLIELKKKAEGRHRYKVRATRRVHVPAAGPCAHYLSTHEESFPFGKGQQYASGAEALKAAEKRAADLIPLSSGVSIWRMNGHGGSGRYLMEEKDRLFTCGWEHVALREALEGIE